MSTHDAEDIFTAVADDPIINPDEAVFYGDEGSEPGKHSNASGEASRTSYEAAVAGHGSRATAHQTTAAVVVAPILPAADTTTDAPSPMGTQAAGDINDASSKNVRQTKAAVELSSPAVVNVNSNLESSPPTTQVPSSSAKSEIVVNADTSNGDGDVDDMQPEDESGRLSRMPSDMERDTVAAVGQLNEQRKLTRRMNDDLRWLQLTQQEMVDMLGGDLRHNEYFDMKAFEHTVNSVWKDREDQDKSPSSKSTVKLFNSTRLHMLSSIAGPNASRASSALSTRGGEASSLSGTSGATHLRDWTGAITAALPPSSGSGGGAVAVPALTRRNVDESATTLSEIADVGMRHPLLLRQKAKHEERRAMFRTAMQEKASATRTAIETTAAGSPPPPPTGATSTAMPTKWRLLEPIDVAVASAGRLSATDGSTPQSKSRRNVDHGAGAAQDTTESVLSLAVPSTSAIPAPESPAVVVSTAVASPSATRSVTTPTDYVRLLREQQQLLARAATNDETVYRPMLAQYMKYTKESQERLMNAVDEALERFDERQQKRAANDGTGTSNP